MKASSKTSSRGFYPIPPQLATPIILTIITSNPFGADNSLCYEWASGLDIPRRRSTVIYTGCLYQLMSYSASIVEIYSRLTPGIVALISEVFLRYPKLAGSIVRGIIRRDESIYRYAVASLRNIAMLLKLSGVDFGYLYEDDIYSGVYLHEAGFIDEFIKHAKRVYSVFKRNGVERIITIDPHTTDVLKNIYPTYIDGFDIEVLHYSEVIDKNKLGTIGGSHDQRYVVHDPCYIVRKLRLLNRVRGLIDDIGYITPERSGENTYCCGGPIEGVSPTLSLKIAINRIKELANTGADGVIVSCPICYINLSRASKASGLMNLKIIDLPQILIDLNRRDK